MTRNIRNIFQRAGLHRHEVQTLHGIVSDLVRGPMGTNDATPSPPTGLSRRDKWPPA